MHNVSRPLCILANAVLFLLLACALTPSVVTSPTATAIPSAAVTGMTGTDTAIANPITETSELPSVEATGWLSQLEVIRSGNWARLQLLKTFPAEIPLLNSAVAISLDGKTMAVGSNSRAQIFFFDLGSGQLFQTVPISAVSNVDAPFRKIEYLSDGTLIANSDGPYMIYRIDIPGNILSTWESSSFALSADKRIMAYGTVEAVTLTDIPNNTSLGSFEADYAVEYSFSPDGTKIAVNVVGVDYADTVVWDIMNQKELTRLSETGNPRYSPNGKFLAVTSYEENTTPLKIFSPDGATEITTLDVSDPNGLNGMAPVWSLDGSVLTAQIGEGLVVAWDTTNWQPLDASALQGELYSLSPDGRLLITRIADGGILLWGVVH
jgi:WD40 repeat protein